jgi:DNA-binding CsgD family transcriptional regulator
LRSGIAPLVPAGLRAAEFTVGGDRFAVISLPLCAPVLPASLTAAEREVAQLVLEGRTNSEIAAVRGTSLRTVANQVASVLSKSKVRSRSQLGSCSKENADEARRVDVIARSG